ncbi:MAG TPA: amidohydrolase family protein [Nitrososphaerales archaeon]|nr:amidohydrolase family protein [Nitrososphaerales archaeon]
MADIIIKKAERVVCSAAPRRILKDATVVISDGRIEDVIEGRSVGIGADAIIDGRGRLVTPGLINAHVHVEETLGMGMVPETVRHIPWFERWILPYYDALTETDAYYSAFLSQLLMLRCGITCYADSANLYPESSARAASESGIRAFVARWTCDIGKYRPSPINRCLSESEKLLKKYSKGRVRALAAVIGLNQCSNELYLSIKELADKYDVVALSHESSGHEDVLRSIKRLGMRPIENLEKIGFLSSRTLLSHLTDVSEREVGMLMRSGTKVSLCPSSELKKGKGLFQYGKLPLMIRSGLKFCLGTDTANSSNHLNVLRSIYLLALLAKDHAMDPAVMNAQRALGIITNEGGECLGLEEGHGTIEKGRTADVAVFDLDELEWSTTQHDAIQWLIYGGTPSAYATIVDGRVAYAGGRFAVRHFNSLVKQFALRAAGIKNALAADSTREQPEGLSATKS